jgi:hypothetical protein
MTDPRTNNEIVSPEDKLTFEPFAGEGEATRDVIFGAHGWYAIIQKADGGPGEEYTIRYRPFSKDVNHLLETLRRESSESSPGEHTT